ncbi:hypothetical protein KUTeg_006599 [Tegillarca granosa]|uniref:Organic cation transporter protein n=1 Tax=Tegillarca granosa TaxID=220873 RepID=A0ABQ9FAS7_TEGGR|nr:hypothetical protein KUTeg_006599 [Tegillarca granosa]
MHFEDILRSLGEFGFYQKRLYLLLCIPAISTGCYMMMLVFVMEPPDHRTIPDSDNSLHKYNQCYMYRYNNISSVYDGGNRTLVKCIEWVYDKSVFKETFTSKNNLVCDDKLKTSHAQMVFYFGVLVGDLSFGILSDTIGRKKTFTITVFIVLASALGVAWAPEFYSFCVLEFIVGAAHHGAFMICCVLGIEMVGPSKRAWAGILIHAFFTTGLVYLSGIAYFFRNWQYVQLAVAAPFIPESPRWLISQRKYDEAEKIIQKAAKTNKVNIPKKTVDSETIITRTEGRVWQIVISMVYYGVTMHTGDLGGDFYLNFFILAVIEYPGRVLTIALLDRLGRKKLHCLCMLTGGFACLGTIFSVTFGGDGKFGAAAAFGTVYIYSLELFPTVVRNGGMGLSSCIARLGGMAAPYVAKSGDLVGGDFGQALPLVIFGGCSVSAGLLSMLLPETLNQKLPDTIEDAQVFGKYVIHVIIYQNYHFPNKRRNKEENGALCY